MVGLVLGIKTYTHKPRDTNYACIMQQVLKGVYLLLLFIDEYAHENYNSIML